MKAICDMNKEELSCLRLQDVPEFLDGESVLHILKTVGALWICDFDDRLPPYHALLKSEKHSAGFADLSILFKFGNMLDIFARQMAERIQDACVGRFDCIAGVPKGATLLAGKLSEIFGVSSFVMTKRNGCIICEENISPDSKVLIVDDVCTDATGFKETLRVLLEKERSLIPTLSFPVILNRGGLEFVYAQEESYEIIPVLDYHIPDWDPQLVACPLCGEGSVPIRPKESEENWKLFTQPPIAVLKRQG